MVKVGMGRLAGILAWIGGCGPGVASPPGEMQDGSSEGAVAGDGTDEAEADSGECDFVPPVDDDPPMPLWCDFVETEVRELARTAEPVFGTETGDHRSAMGWDGERVLFTFSVGEPGASEYEIRGSLAGDANFDTTWEIPPGRGPVAIESTTAGTLVVAERYTGPASSDAVLRLGPDGEVEILAELDLDVGHPIVVDGDWVYVMAYDVDGELRPGRIALADGGVEVFDFSVVSFAPRDGTLVGLRMYTDDHCLCSEMNCDWFCEICLDVVEWHRLLAYDLQGGAESTIADSLCVAGNGDAGVVKLPPVTVGIVGDGLVIYDGPIVHVGFDGMRRVVAAVPGDLDDVRVAGDWVYFVTSLEPTGVNASSIGRVPLAGGDAEELARIDDADFHPISLGTVTATHLYVWERDTADADASVVRRIAL